MGLLSRRRTWPYSDHRDHSGVDGPNLISCFFEGSSSSFFESIPSRPFKVLNDSKHWRDRAAEMRVLFVEMKDTQAQRKMLKLANDYDKFADRAEDRARNKTPGPSPIPKP
jgi:hypothetical protein